MSQPTPIIVLGQEVFESHMRVLLNRLDSLQAEVNKLRNGGQDQLIRIGEVKDILKASGKKCSDNRTAQNWLKEKNILPQMQEGSTHKYYSRNAVKSALNY